MTEQHDLSYMYRRAKTHDGLGFVYALGPREKYADWTLNRLFRETREVVQTTGDSKLRTQIADHLHMSSYFRAKITIEAFQSIKRTTAYRGHLWMIGQLQTVVAVARKQPPPDTGTFDALQNLCYQLIAQPLDKQRMNGDNSCPADGGTTLDEIAADDDYAQHDISHLTMDENELLVILGAAKAIADEAVDCWRQLLSGKQRLPLAAVSVAANTRIKDLVAMFHAAELIYPSCFKESVNIGDASTYWSTLQGLRRGEAVDKAFATFCAPADTCRLSNRCAHFPYQLLGRAWKADLVDFNPSESHTGILVPLRTAAVLDYANQVHSLYADDDESLRTFKKQVDELIFQTDILLDENAESVASIIKVASESQISLAEMKQYAEQANDILALGFVAEVVEAPRIACTVQLMSCPILRMFSCAYELLRRAGHLDHSIQPLEAFFQDELAAPLLWLDGRPQSIREIQNLVRKSFTVEGIKSHWKLVVSRCGKIQEGCIFLALRAQTSSRKTQEERDNSVYRLTADLQKRLKKSSVAEHLAAELESFSPDWVKIRRELIAVIRSLAGEQLTVLECLRWLQQRIFCADAKSAKWIIVTERVLEIAQHLRKTIAP